MSNAVFIDDVSESKSFMRLSRMRDLFMNGRHHSMTWLLTSQLRVELYPGYDYCPECKGYININCKPCKSIGMIMTDEFRKLPSGERTRITLHIMMAENAAKDARKIDIIVSDKKEKNKENSKRENSKKGE